MLEVTNNDLQQVAGGKIHIGAMVSSLVVGFVTGGPIGLGFAAGGIIMASGIDNLHDMVGN